MVVAVCGHVSPAPAQTKYWELEPYNIHATIAVDVPGKLDEALHDRLSEHLQERVDAVVGPFWNLTVEWASPQARYCILSSLDDISCEDVEVDSNDWDKLLLLRVRMTDHGFELTGREYDCLVDRWSPPISRATRQVATVPEELFRLVRQVFAPVAQFRLDPQDSDRVQLSFKGASLPSKNVDGDWVNVGDVLLPYFRQTTRTGELVPDGIRLVPWTLLTVEEMEGATAAASVQSGARRPFGARRRGRIEQVGIVLRGNPGDVILQMRSRQDMAKPLVGYEVFIQSADGTTTHSVGLSDRLGNVRLKLKDKAVHMLYVKSGAEVLARVPAVSLLGEPLVISLPNEERRLMAESRLTAMRESLIDLVARRNILMARIRKSIDDEHWDDAQRLLNELDALPGRSQFNQQLRKEEQLAQADDPQTQRRINNLFAETRVVLGRFLDTRPISELHDELNRARRENR